MLPVPVLARVLATTWQDDEIDPLIALLVELREAVLLFTLETVELTADQLARLTAAHLDMQFCPLVKANDLFKKISFLEPVRADCEKVRARLP
jgi:hypothetical protein